MIIWCHQHRKLDESHPLVADMIQSASNPVAPNQNGEPEYILRIRLETALEKIAGGICPFCGDALMDEAGFVAWHEEWKDDHRNMCYCAECGEEHTAFSRSNGINIAPCGGRWRPLGLHPRKIRDGRGKPVDIQGDAEKLAEHHDKIRYGVYWHADGAPRPSESVEWGKKYHALVKGHPVVQ